MSDDFARGIPLQVMEFRDAVNAELPGWIKVHRIDPLGDHGSYSFETRMMIYSRTSAHVDVMVSLGVSARYVANQLKRSALEAMGVRELQAGLKEILDWLENDQPNHAQMVALELLEAFEEGCLVEREETP